MIANTPATANDTGTLHFSDWRNRQLIGGTPVYAYSISQRNTETYFDHKDAAHKYRSHYRKLERHDREKVRLRPDTNVPKMIDWEYHNHITEAVGNQLDLHNEQMQYAKQLYKRVDKGRLGRYSDLTAFCCCVLSLTHGRTNRAYHPARRDENNDPVFLKIAQWYETRFHIKPEHITSVMNKIQHRHPDPPI